MHGRAWGCSGISAQPRFFVHLSYDFCALGALRGCLIRSTCLHTYIGRRLTNARCRSIYHQQDQECNYEPIRDTNHYRRASTTIPIEASTDAGHEWRSSASIRPFGASQHPLFRGRGTRRCYLSSPMEQLDVRWTAEIVLQTCFRAIAVVASRMR